MRPWCMSILRGVAYRQGTGKKAQRLQLQQQHYNYNCNKGIIQRVSRSYVFAICSSLFSPCRFVLKSHNVVSIGHSEICRNRVFHQGFSMVPVKHHAGDECKGCHHFQFHQFRLALSSHDSAWRRRVKALARRRYGSSNNDCVL
jgi:hypothetical protein